MSFFDLAMLQAVLAAVLAGLVGVLVVIRKRAFFTMSLTHATFPGAVLAAMLGCSVPLGAAATAVVLVVIASAIGRLRTQGSATASGIMLTAGFAVGALLQSVSVVPVDVESFLVGQVLATRPGDVAVTGVVLALVVLVWLVCGRRLVFSSFDAPGYERSGLRGALPEVVSLAVIAATVVAIMPVVGAILAVSLIVAPAAAARILVPDVRRMLLIAPAIGAVCSVIALLLSRGFGVSAGGAMTLLAALAFVLVRGWASFRSRRRDSRTALKSATVSAR